MTWFLIATGVAAALVWVFTIDVPRAKLRGDVRVQIAEFPGKGPAKIVGHALAADGELVAPLSGRRCFAYVVSARDTGGDGGGIVAETRAGVEFIVEDGTGRALVDPTGAEISIGLDHVSHSGMFDDPNERQRAFLKGQGEDALNWLGLNRELTYAEGIIHPGEEVAVLGNAVREPDPDGVAARGLYRAGPPERLRMGHSKRAPLYISDHVDTVAV